MVFSTIDAQRILGQERTDLATSGKRSERFRRGLRARKAEGKRARGPLADAVTAGSMALTAAYIKRTGCDEARDGRAIESQVGFQPVSGLNEVERKFLERLRDGPQRARLDQDGGDVYVFDEGTPQQRVFPRAFIDRLRDDGLIEGVDVSGQGFKGADFVLTTEGEAVVAADG